MKNKLLLGITLVALPLTLAACGSNGKSNANDSSSAKTTMNVKKTVMSKTGEIVGSYNSKDKKVLGATLPGKKVIFTVPKTKGDTTHLHFAFMHAASGSKGWYFAPNSETGIDLNNNSMKSGSTKDITNEIGLFEAPDKNTVKKVTKDSGKLKYENIDKYMSASVKEKNGKYVQQATAAKQARGDMVRYILENNIKEIDEIKNFSVNGYQYEPQFSTDTELVFIKN